MFRGNSLQISESNDPSDIDQTEMLSLTAIFIRIAKLDGVFDKGLLGSNLF